MIAIGGTIGVGLFMGSNSSIKWTGPSVLIAYAISGLFIYFIMRALGELVYLDPNTGSFAKYANEYLSPFFGYLTAWSNIFQWIVVGMSEVIAIGNYFQFWFPNFPRWIPGLIAVFSIFLANLISVKAFGELEFWFSFIKVLTIILMIVAGIGLIVFGIGNNFHPLGISNLWSHGFFTGGVKGFIFSLSIVLASYQGVELIGITSGETKNPKKNLTKAIRSIIFRILIFYIGAIFVIVTIYPWDKLNQIGSPFVQTFAKIGVTSAASIINFVVITAALSGTNSGIYSASRMIYTLANHSHLSKRFLKLNRFGVPIYCVIAVSFGIFFGVIFNIILPIFLRGSNRVFILVYSSSVFPGMVPWFVILISQINFRKKHFFEIRNHPFKMPFSPFSNYITLFFLILTLIFMLFNPDTRAPLLIGTLFLLIISIIYFFFIYKKHSYKEQDN